MSLEVHRIHIYNERGIDILFSFEGVRGAGAGAGAGKGLTDVARLLLLLIKRPFLTNWIVDQE